MTLHLPVQVDDERGDQVSIPALTVVVSQDGGGLLFTIAYELLGSAADAEDVLQAAEIPALNVRIGSGFSTAASLLPAVGHGAVSWGNANAFSARSVRAHGAGLFRAVVLW